MGRLVGVLLAAAALGGLFASPGRAQDKQSLAEIAAEAKRKKQESTRPVLTNDDLPGTPAAPAIGAGAGLPAVQVGKPSENPPRLAPYVPSPMGIVEAMLELAGVGPEDVVFDIGSGDGRIVIAAAELHGAFGVGIEIDPDLVVRSRRAIEEKGLTDRVRIIQANALDVDLSEADVVTLYLTVSGNEALRPHLEASLRRGTRVVSREFKIQDWTPLEEREVMGSILYFYRVH
jgi:SAM-dependent methyltransferase